MVLKIDGYLFANIDLFFRLKTEVDRKELELSETVSRLTSKHQNETSDLKYLLQESDLSKKELQNELNVYKSKLSGDEDSVDELQNKLSQMKLRCEQAERKCSDLIEENERLSEDMSSVSVSVLDFCSPFIMICFGSIGMDRVIETIL